MLKARLIEQDVIPAQPGILPFALRRWSRVALYLMMSFAIALLLLVFIALAPHIYSQKSAGWLDPKIQAYCSILTSNQGDDCNIQIMPLQDGRYRISAKLFPGDSLNLTFHFFQGITPRILVMRRGTDYLDPFKSQIKVMLNGVEIKDNQILNENKGSFSKRVISSVPELRALQISIQMTNLANTVSKPTSLVIDEIGFLMNSPEQSKNTIEQWLIQHHTDDFYNFPLLLMGIFALSALSAQFVKRDRYKFQLLNVIFITSYSLVILTIGLFFQFSSDSNQDLRVMYASGTLQEVPGWNLNYGLYMASNFLQGHGPVILPGEPPWHRMPGYGILLSLAALFADQSTNLLQIALNSIFFQLLLIALSTGLFFWSAGKIMAPVIAGIISLCVIYLPNSIYYVQIEGMMPAIILENLSVACIYINAQNKLSHGLPTFFYHLLLHSGFALWYFIRPDVVPAWFIVSLLLYGRRKATWKYMMIPLTYYLLIGLSWAFFKLQYTHEFSMSTNSAGASLMVGLWEIPHKFIWTVSDGSYYKWVNNEGIFSTKAVANIAVHEVFRFYLTYPFYLLALVWHKFILYMSTYMVSILGFSFKMKLLYLFAMIASFLIRYKPWQTLLLGWPVFFNLTIFFLTYSSAGRFYLVPTISLFITAVPLLCDYQFYLKLCMHKWIALCLLSMALLIYFYGVALDDMMIASDDFRYFTPFLDPNKSSFNIVQT